MKILQTSNVALKKSIAVIKSGGIVVCPTDTVYGFLADASNKKAVDKIYKIKKRQRSKPLSVFVKDLKMAKKIAEISKEQEKILTLRLRSGQAKFWPGKYTFILKRKIDKKLYGVDKKTIAIRIPKYKFLNDLLKKVNKPLVQTSVNISGEAPLIKIGDMVEKFGKNKNIIIIDTGSLKKSNPSKIIDITNGVLTRIR